jgi:hypothetical protein
VKISWFQQLPGSVMFSSECTHSSVILQVYPLLFSFVVHVIISPWRMIHLNSHNLSELTTPLDLHLEEWIETRQAYRVNMIFKKESKHEAHFSMLRHTYVVQYIACLLSSLSARYQEYQNISGTLQNPERSGKTWCLLNFYSIAYVVNETIASTAHHLPCSQILLGVSEMISSRRSFLLNGTRLFVFLPIT